MPVVTERLWKEKTDVRFLVWGPLVIRCVPDEDAQALYLKGENDADH